MKNAVLVLMVSVFALANIAGCGGDTEGPAVTEMSDADIAAYEAREKLRQEQMSEEE